MEFINEISVDGIIQGAVVLSLVGVTIWYAWNMHTQSENLKKQNTLIKEQEERSKKEKQLNIIIEWANNIYLWDNSKYVEKVE